MFFKKGTDNNDLVIDQKYDNIYNLDEINKSINRDIIIAKILARKLVMYYAEESCINFMN